MKIFKQIGPLQAFLDDRRAAGDTVGLVPTMGALHRGHMSLIHASRQNGDLTVCSLFVNPTQFNDPADLRNYPRTLEADQEMLEAADCKALFAPDAQDMYEQESRVRFDFGEAGTILEGKFRPGHFSGVALVVSKLFNIVRPARAYFGRKDYQQFRIISLLNEELKFGIQLHGLPTMREQDGLAMSSRNLRLTSKDRQDATALFRTLQEAKASLRDGKPWEHVRMVAARNLAAIDGLRLEYLELVNKDDLSERFRTVSDCVLLIAAHVGPVRLIDNLVIGD